LSGSRGRDIFKQRPEYKIESAVAGVVKNNLIKQTEIGNSN